MLDTTPPTAQEQPEEELQPLVASEEKPVQFWEPLLAALLLFSFLCAFVPHLLDRLNPPTGDEPFYLVTAISLLQDGDLDEANQYANKDYYQFAPTCQQMQKPGWGDMGDPPVYNTSGLYAPGLRADCPGIILDSSLTNLPPHESKGTRQPGLYTKHGIGLSVLIAPAYALANRPGVVFFIMALAALLAANIWLLAFETTGQRRVAWITWGLLAFTTPLLCFSYLIFPAVPAALLVTYAWRRLRLAARARQYQLEVEETPLRAVTIGLCVGILPWLHSIYLPISVGLMLYWLFGGRGNIFSKENRKATSIHQWWQRLYPADWQRNSVIALLVPLVSLAGLFLAFYLYLYGSPLPNTQDHAGFAPPYLLPWGFFGLLFDQKYGLLIYAPVYLLTLAGLYWMTRPTGYSEENTARRSDLFWMGTVALPYVLLISCYNQWWGEWCPPARYLVPILPLLAVPLALVLSEFSGKFFQAVLFGAVFWSGAVSALFMYNPHLMFNWQTLNPAVSLSWLEANLPLLAETRLGLYFPSYVTNLNINNQEPNVPAIAGWLIVVGLLVVGLIFNESRRNPLLPSQENLTETSLNETS